VSQKSIDLYLRQKKSLKSSTIESLMSYDLIQTTL
jgi:hypothetical protein